MEIKGKIYDILPAQSGRSSKGEWKKQEFIIETQDQYPKKICLTNWNDKVDIGNLSKGMDIKAHIDIESRNFNDRWYTDVKIWQIDIEGQGKIIEEPVEQDIPESDNSPSIYNDEKDPLDTLPF